MEKRYNKLHKKLKKLLKSWLVLLVWILVFSIVLQTAGIVIHELGHYTAGKIYGCENLSISIAKFSFKDSISSVSGWDPCKYPLVVDRDGTKICNSKTIFIFFSGLALSLIVFIPFIVFLNKILKNKFKTFYLNKQHLTLIILFVIMMTINAAILDLFRIGECLFNTNTANMILKLINALPTLMIVPILGVFLWELFFED